MTGVAADDFVERVRARRAGAAWRTLALLLIGWFWSCAVAAQMLDDIESRSLGNTQVLRVRFNASVRFLQVTPTQVTDLYTVRFEVIAADDAVLRQTTDESRRLPAAEEMPEVVIGLAAEPASRIRQLTVRLARALPLQARQGANARSIELLLRRPAPATGRDLEIPITTRADTPGAAAEPATPEQLALERQAEGLMAQARGELQARRAEAAVASLNELLKLPPNRQTMAAQALIGEAWEAADNPQRAKIEYALYLRLYPQGEQAAHVGQRLVALGGQVARSPDGATVASAAAEPPKTWSGTLAQYYYGGKARSKSLVNIATGIDQATLSRTTESSIVTSLDLSGRFDAMGGENRAVVRGSGSANLLTSSHSSSSIGAAYVEHRRANQGLAVRAGRQSPISGGLLGLFDGVSLAWPVASGIKLDLMGGVPASALVSAPSERLFAAVVEADTLFDRWGGNFYLLDQSTQGITNRRALGAEMRYAGEQWSSNAIVDYDTLFRMVNALSVHGSFQVGQQTTVTVLVDERRAPSLQLTNAMISSGAASLKDLLRTRTLEQVRGDALATSAIARQLMASVSRPIDSRWQLSMDMRYSAVGALPAVGDFEATPATGAQYNLSVQLTGTNLYSSRDINNLNFSVITTPFFKGVQASYNNLTGTTVREHEVTLEPSVRLYVQRDNQDVRLWRLGPGVRATWRHSRRTSLLGELLFETSRTDGPTNHDRSTSVFFYLGYRYELF